MMPSGPAVALALLWAAGDSPAETARSPSDQARAHFDAGVAQLDAQNFAAALDEFNHAYAIRPHYAVLYNVAQCWLRLGDLPRAMETFDSYLSQGMNDISPGRAKEVAGIQKAHTGELGVLFVAGNQTGATVRIDGAERGVLPLGHRLWLSPGTHVVSIAAAGFETHEETIDVGRGQDVRISVTLQPSVTPPHVGEVQIDCPHAPPTVTIDDRPYTLDTRQRLKLTEGFHSLVLVRDGQPPHLGALIVKADDVVHYRCPAAATDPALLGREAASSKGPGNTARYASCGGGALLLAGAAGVFFWNGSRYSDWQDQDAALTRASMNGSLTPAQIREQTQQNDDRLRSIQHVDYLVLGLGIAAAAAGVACGVLTYQHQKEGEH